PSVIRIPLHVYLHTLISYISLLLLPPPPRATLFPYTTLFRSLRQLALDRRAREPSAGAGHLPRAAQERPDHRAQHRAVLRPGQGDRKSTRLNSSHGSISYAVFCLKKKNNTTTANNYRSDECAT